MTPKIVATPTSEPRRSSNSNSTPTPRFQEVGNSSSTPTPSCLELLGLAWRRDCSGRAVGQHARPTTAGAQVRARAAMPGTAACVRARPVGARGNVCTCEARVRVFAARAHVCACQPRLYTLPLISSISRSIRLSGTPRTSTHDSSYVKVMDTSSADEKKK